MNEEQIMFSSGELTLEGMMAKPGTSTVQRGAVVCHPHPMYGGSMHNNVVEAILNALWQRCYATVRFNFRGVGASEGEYDGGIGELDDARGAAAWITEKTGLEALTLAGYSFGASVAVRAGISDPRFDRVIAVALPIGLMNPDATEPVGKTVALISGDSDD